jgi:hypothetical protein
MLAWEGQDLASVTAWKPVPVDKDDEESLAYSLEPSAAKKAPKIRKQDTQQIMPMRGGLRGKAKKTEWVDIDSLVMIAETG